MEVEVVFFDWDMTLARAIGDVSQTLRLTALFAREGLEFTPQQVDFAIEKYYRNGGSSIHGKSLQTPAEIMHFYNRILHHLGADNLESGLMRRLYDGYAYLPTLLYEDTLPTVAKLHDAGLLIGIITNHSRTARAGIEDYMGQWVDPAAIVISEELGSHKPEPAIFAEAVASLGVDPSVCMMVGDNLHVDVIGAVEQGGFCCGVWLDRRLQGDRSLPTAVSRITSLHELLPLLQTEAS